jgi:hypothetical protein
MDETLENWKRRDYGTRSLKYLLLEGGESKLSLQSSKSNAPPKRLGKTETSA